MRLAHCLHNTDNLLHRLFSSILHALREHDLLGSAITSGAAHTSDRQHQHLDPAAAANAAAAGAAGAGGGSSNLRGAQQRGRQAANAAAALATRHESALAHQVMAVLLAGLHSQVVRQCLRADRAQDALVYMCRLPADARLYSSLMKELVKHGSMPDLHEAVQLRSMIGLPQDRCAATAHPL